MSPQDYFPLFISYEFPFLLLPFFFLFELSTLRYTFGWIVSFFYALILDVPLAVKTRKECFG